MQRNLFNVRCIRGRPPPARRGNAEPLLQSRGA
jgi:hypothetical protein